MHPVHDTRTAQATAVNSHELIRALVASMAAIALTGVVLAAVILLTSQPATPGNSSAGAASEILDGWSSYLGAAAEPADLAVVDGWSSSLLARELEPASVRDGWGSYLLTDAPAAPDVIDGWMIRFGDDD